MTRVRIGTRGSALALWQARHIAGRLREAVPGLDVVLVEISSAGDRITDVPLSHVEGTGFFTAAIERALTDGAVDVAVHSFKDLPIDTTPGLVVAAVPGRAPVEDALCARDGLTLAALPAGARVGTCSARRTAQVRRARPDVTIVPLRGNVPTRVARVGTDLDAIVLARAGLIRLGLDHDITEVFGLDRMLPAPAQGALAVQCRAGDRTLLAHLSTLDDGPSRRAVQAERSVLHALGGGCSVPVGAAAEAVGSRLRLDAGVFALDGARMARATFEGDDPEALGLAAARRLIDEGARDILADFARHPAPAVLDSGAPA